MKHFCKIYIGLVFLFLFAPLLVILIYSFNQSNSSSVFTGFSLQWYRALLQDTELINALKNSIILAVLSSVIATVIGTAAAVGIHAFRRKWTKSVAMTVTNIPMMNPDIVTGISMMLLFVFVGVLVGTKSVLGFTTLLIAHITFNIPYVLLSVMPKLNQTDAHLSEAAEDLGCTRLKSFFRVILPAISSGISTGFVMAFTLSLDDFVISHFTSGSDFQTLPILIYSMTKKHVRMDIYALSTVVFIAVLVLLILNNIGKGEDPVQREASVKARRAKKAAKPVADRNKTVVPRVCKVTSVLLVAVLSASVIIFSGYANKNAEPLVALRGTYTRDLAGTTLNVYNWGEYISDGYEDTLDVNAEFEKITGIKVNYTNYDSNESMYSKLSGGGIAYDVIIPSDYMIARMANEGLLMKLDTAKLTNYKYIDSAYKNAYFDPNNEYSVPYSVGMVGLIYDKTVISAEDAASWKVLWSEEYKPYGILNFNNPRDAFATAQFLLGLDVNSESKADLQKAAEKLKQQKPLIQSYVMDEVFDKMESGEAAVAPYYAGDYFTMAENNEKLAFAYPKEGTNIFIDSICIPKTAQNYEAAMLYINFLLEPEIARANAEYIGYASPNTEVVNNPEYEYYQNEILYPTAAQKPKTSYFEDLSDELKKEMDRLWESVKLS